MEQLAALLKAKKLKVTPQRLAIYNVLYNTVEHPSAETIYASLQSTHPTMSLATVYKTLDALKKADLVNAINVGEDSFRYDANISSHPHLICVSCGVVADLHTDLLTSLKDTVQNQTDFDILSQKVFFYGTCSSCQKKTS